ncbi:hypothetical protein [Streptomyces sp. NPDC053755]|uniref:hypothetical protein n=1 Tax=Streptomyces sp. NPDC053755 TaxID=3155815 RepID=UPI0034219100
MRVTSLRLPAAVVLGGALLLPLSCMPALAAPAPAPDGSWRETDVANGDFSAPALSATAEASQETVPKEWSGRDVMLFSGPLARRSDKRQAVSLNDSTGPGVLRQRLWRVNAGAKVRVSFHDSASTLSTCTPDRVADGQRYKVSTYKPVPYGVDGKPSADREVHHSQEYRTEGYTKPPNKTGDGSWTPEAEVFEFTAAEDNPLVAFESLEKPTGSGDEEKKCGPLIAAVTAQQQAAAVDHYIEQNDMPWHAYKGDDEISLETALESCKGVNACRFTADPDYSYQYYSKVRVVGYAAINCTRNQKTDKRTLSYTEEGFDSITQELRHLKNAAQVDQNLANSGADDKGAGSPNLQEAFPEMFKQAAAGFQRLQGNTRLVNTTDPLTTTRTVDKTVDQAVQPSEASWYEVQASRERVEGTFRGSGNVRIDAMLDYPSNRVPDRFYQRTGPMTQDEQRHCLTERPLRVTPDNGGVDPGSDPRSTAPRTPGHAAAPGPAAGHAQAPGFAPGPVHATGAAGLPTPAGTTQHSAHTGPAPAFHAAPAAGFRAEVSVPSGPRSPAPGGLKTVRLQPLTQVPATPAVQPAPRGAVS